MKIQNIILTLCLARLLTTGNIALAQSPATTVPSKVSTAFLQKYSKGRLKKWKNNNEGYVAVFKLNHHTYQATFDKNGNWLETTQKLTWPWKLPDPVKDGLNKSDHGSWHCYEVFIIARPGGSFYRILMDNTNHPIDAQHQLALTQDWQIDVSAEGDLISEANISHPMVTFRE